MDLVNTCYNCDWYSPEYGKCELLDVERDKDDPICPEFIQEVMDED